MGRKMKLSFLYRGTSDPIPSPWPFPSCGNIRTHSFRVAQNEIFRTVNSAFIDSTITSATATPEVSVVTTTTSSTPETSGAFSSSMSVDSSSGDNEIETVIRGLRSERLFFEPGESNSIMESSAARTTIGSRGRGGGGGGGGDGCGNAVPYEESVVLSMESKDPYVDFRKSMEEMVEAHGLKSWEGLEELLGWYLRVNGKNSHGYIISAFIDLLVSLSFDNCITATTTTNSTSSSSASSSSSSLVTSTTSPLSPLSQPSSSSLTTPCLSSLDEGDEEDDDHVQSS